MTSICSSAFEFETDELKRCYREALKANDKHLETIQSLEKDLSGLYLQQSLLKDAADGLYRQSLELTKHLHQQDPAVKTNPIAQNFSDKLLNFQADYVRFCKGDVGTGQSSDMKEAEKVIESLEDEVHALKFEIVQTSMQENQQVEELKQQSEELKQTMEELKYEIQRKDLRIDTLAEKLKSSKDDNKCNELEVLTREVNRLMEDNELLKMCQENDSITIAELEGKLKEANHHTVITTVKSANESKEMLVNDNMKLAELEELLNNMERDIISKNEEIAILTLKLQQLQQLPPPPPGFYKAPARPLVQRRTLGERLVQAAQLMNTPKPPPSST